MTLLELQSENNGEPLSLTLGSPTNSNGFVQLPPELLTLIVKNVDNRHSLLTCRRVNSTWFLVTNPVLRISNRHQITFDGSSSNSSTNNILVKKCPCPSKNMMFFTSCLVTCTKIWGKMDHFPGHRFKFSWMNLEEENSQNFLNLYGPQIHSLDLSNFTTNFRSLNHLLIRQAPNIQHLTLGPLYITSETGSACSLFENEQMKLLLPHLNKFTNNLIWTRAEKNLIGQIIEVAPNLQNYQLTSFSSLVPIDTMSKGRGNILKKIDMRFTQENIQLSEKLACFEPKLKSWKFGIDLSTRDDPTFLKRVGIVISKILESSRNTLLKIDPVLSFGQDQDDLDVKFPVMDTLKEFSNRYYTRHQIFPPGFKNPAAIFPNVKTVHFSAPTHPKSDTDDHNLAFDLNQNCWQWPSVHSLSINSFFQNFVPNVAHLFPKLKKLRVDLGDCNFSLFCRQIFEHMTELECLEFMGFNCSLPQNKFPCLDSVLTGFSLETCLRLASGEILVSGEEIEILRENLSILELTGLTSLKMTINWGSSTPSLDDLDLPRILSRVSAIYAFQRMPQLTVTVNVCPPLNDVDCYSNKARAALQSIAPFVHWMGFE